MNNNHWSDIIPGRPALEDEMISNNDIHKVLGLSLSTIYALRNAGDFFEPVRLSKRRIAWRKTDALAWLASR